MSAKKMMLFDKARRIVKSHARFLGTERVEINEALGRVLAKDVTSDMDMPPFDKSAMDGFACRHEDLKNTLTVVETIPAGKVPKKSLGKNECARTMTGSIVPEGADCVIKLEDTEQINESTTRFTAGDIPDNICRKGEDIKAGDVVLRKGEIIRPQHIGVLATVGCVSPLVARRPIVGIVATGNELIEPKSNPGPSQIRNSNSYQLCAQVTRAGAIPEYHGIALDTEDATDKAVKKVMAKSDVILLSGGVSMGDFDVVPDILKKNGFNLLFEKIAVKPGMPTVFGISDKVFCFGLPGNPVSTFVIFEILVKPFLFKLVGHDFKPPIISMRLDKTIKRKKTERDSWIPASRIEDEGRGGIATKRHKRHEEEEKRRGEEHRTSNIEHSTSKWGKGKGEGGGETEGVRAIEYHGSAHLNALTDAFGLICVPRGVAEIQKGTFVHVRQI